MAESHLIPAKTPICSTGARNPLSAPFRRSFVGKTLASAPSSTRYSPDPSARAALAPSSVFLFSLYASIASFPINSRLPSSASSLVSRTRTQQRDQPVQSLPPIDPPQTNPFSLQSPSSPSFNPPPRHEVSLYRTYQAMA